MGFWKNTSPRRSQVRKNITAERFSRISELANTDFCTSVLIWLLFVVICTLILSIPQAGIVEVAPIAVIVVLISLGGALYIHHFQKRITKNHARALVLVGLFVLLLAINRLLTLSTGWNLNSRISTCFW